MSNETICPSSLDGIKRLAKTIKHEQGIKHHQALEEAAKLGGFQNFRHANNILVANHSPVKQQESHIVFITAYWKDRNTNTRGRETLTIRLSMPWGELIQPAQFQNHRAFINVRAEGPDHLARSDMSSSQSGARRLVCATARTLNFMDATKLRPSKSHSKAYPGGRLTNAVPGKDHHSVWYDRESKRYLFVDEPYEKAVESRVSERAEWAKRHGHMIQKPDWPGMYNPDGGSRLYLIADAKKGIPLEPIIAVLNMLPTPITEENWNGESAPMPPYFVSPGTIAKAEESTKKEKAKQAPRKSVGKNNTVGYIWTFVGPQRRPNARMPIETHAEVGRQLKSVLAVSYHRKGVYNRVDAVRSELDEWTQREYNHEELPNEQFFDLYYHGTEHAKYERSMPAEERGRHIESLTLVKIMLAKYYPDCTPLRAMLKRIDAAINSLQSWTS